MTSPRCKEELLYKYGGKPMKKEWRLYRLQLDKTYLMYFQLDECDEPKQKIIRSKIVSATAGEFLLIKKVNRFTFVVNFSDDTPSWIFAADTEVGLTYETICNQDATQNDTREVFKGKSRELWRFTPGEVRQEWIRVLNERWSLTRAASLMVASGKDTRHKELPRRHTTLTLPATTPPSPGPACALNMCYGSSLRGHQPKVSTTPQPPDQLVARQPPTDTQNPSTNSHDDESQQSTAIGGTGGASDHEPIYEQILNPPPSYADVMHDTDEYVEMKPGTSEDSEYVNVLRKK